MKSLSCLVVVLFTVVASGCSIREAITPEGKMVYFATASEITNCQHLGNTKIVLGVATRVALNKPETLANEIANEVRNFAAQVGADTLVPAEKSGSGAQVFRLYVCNKK